MKDEEITKKDPDSDESLYHSWRFVFLFPVALAIGVGFLLLVREIPGLENFRANRAFALAGIAAACSLWRGIFGKPNATLGVSPDASDAELARAYANPYLWHDEFDGSAIDSSKWSFEIGTGNNGWGNDEKEFYTDRPENAYVKDGVLHVRAVKESCQGSDYTSARLVTKGKFSFTYGIVEARIALPAGKGIWPAFWLLGENIESAGWPACGEIDIIEAINDEHVVYGTNHWDCDGRHAQHGRSTKDFYGAKLDLDITQFHTYKTVWSKDAISMYVDGFKYHEMTIKDNAGGTDAFHKPFFFVLNVAVGGNWPGFDIDDSRFPYEMRIEYIRVSSLH